MGKDICFDVSGVITENLMNGKSPKEYPPHSSKDGEISEDKDEILLEDEKKIPRTNCL